MPQLPQEAGDMVPAPAPKHEAHRAEMRAELRAARANGQRWRLISRWLGLGIFIFGAVLLGYVFYQALQGFRVFGNPGYLQGVVNGTSRDNWQESLMALGTTIGTELLKVLYLLILGFIASAIAARGIQFFAASEAVIDEAVIPNESA